MEAINRALEKMTDHSTRKLLVSYAVGECQTADIIAWACEKLGEGLDSPHLRLLAGYLPAEVERDSAEFWKDFRQTLTELGIKTPPERDAFADYTCFICKAMVDGLMPPKQGHGILYEIWAETNFNPAKRIDDRFESWMYLDDSLELIEKGYPALLPRFEGLNRGNYEQFVKDEAKSFLAIYCDCDFD